MQTPRLTSAAKLQGITEGRAAEMITNHDKLDEGFTVEFHNQRAYLWFNGELLADAIL